MGAAKSISGFFIVMEYCEKGNLNEYLLDGCNLITWKDRRRIARQIAQAMIYLHSFPDPILHCDMKSLNIIITKKGDAKLCDFGTYQFASEPNRSTKSGPIGTYNWIAPEVLKNGDVSLKSDVFGFGIVMWELASRKSPFLKRTAIEMATAMAEKNFRPPVHKEWPTDWVTLMTKCWSQCVDDRPSFNDIVVALSGQSSDTQQEDSL